MRNRITLALTALVAIVATAPLAVVTTAVPAQATTCIPGTNICDGGDISKHGVDNGYAQPIFIICNWGDAFQADGDPRGWAALNDAAKLVDEGESSEKYCGIDTDVVVVRDNEQIACRETDRYGNHSWPVRWDASGPHKITDNVHEKHCVTQRD